MKTLQEIVSQLGAGEASQCRAAPSTAPAQNQVMGLQASHGNAAAQQRLSQLCEERTDVTVSGLITGRASPRWEHSQGEDPSALNMALSQERADDVEMWFRELFARGLPEDSRAKFELIGQSIDVSAPLGEQPGTLSTHADGDQTTLEEAGGDRRANNASLRRVDLEVAVTTLHEVCVGTNGSERGTEYIPGDCDPGATTDWSFRSFLSGGGGHAGFGVAGLQGELKNRETGQVAMGFFGGGGFGLGLQTPGASFGEPSWEDFQTRDAVTHQDFHGTGALLVMGGAGVSAGFSLGAINFTSFGSGFINISGWTGGNIGADAGINGGSWWMVDVPGEVCAPGQRIERDWPTEDVRAEQYTTTEILTHTVHFDTGSASTSDAQLLQLQQWIDTVLAEAVPEHVDPLSLFSS